MEDSGFSFGLRRIRNLHIHRLVLLFLGHTLTTTLIPHLLLVLVSGDLLLAHGGHDGSIISKLHHGHPGPILRPSILVTPPEVLDLPGPGTEVLHFLHNLGISAGRERWEERQPRGDEALVRL